MSLLTTTTTYQAPGATDITMSNTADKKRKEAPSDSYDSKVIKKQKAIRVPRPVPVCFPAHDCQEKNLEKLPFDHPFGLCDAHISLLTIEEVKERMRVLLKRSKAYKKSLGITDNESTQDDVSDDESDQDDISDNESGQDDSSNVEGPQDDNIDDESDQDDISDNESGQDDSSNVEGPQDDNIDDEGPQDDSSNEEGSEDESSDDEGFTYVTIDPKLLHPEAAKVYYEAPAAQREFLQNRRQKRRLAAIRRKDKTNTTYNDSPDNDSSDDDSENDSSDYDSDDDTDDDEDMSFEEFARIYNKTPKSKRPQGFV